MHPIRISRMGTTHVMGTCFPTPQHAQEAAPEEHFTPGGGLLVFAADVPQELLDKAVEGAFSAKTLGLSLEASLFHFHLVNHQLLQVGELRFLAPNWASIY